jgi:hypothetical protein
MSSIHDTIEKAKGVAFYVAVGLYVLAFLVLPSREVATQLFTTWFAEPDIHALHDINGAAFLVVTLLGIVVQVYRPERRRTALFGTVLGWLALLVVMAADGSSLVMIPVVFLVLSGLVVIFHRMGRALVCPHTESGFAVVPAVLFLLAAVPVGLYAVNEAMTQIQVTDSHAADGHYGLMAAMSVTLLVHGLFASGAPAGWRFPAWSAGGLAVVFGLSSVLYPVHASSIGSMWGSLAIAWGVVFIVASEARELESAPDTLRRRVGEPGGTETDLRQDAETDGRN